MASVMPPKTNYKISLPKSLITTGALSDAQLEAVVYAGHAHSDMLPDGVRRRGIFIGDGTGVGKGREIAGIILDNWGKGRSKAVWVSEKRALINDAKRDWSGLGRSADDLIDHGKSKPGNAITAKTGILFTSYDTMKSAEQTKVQGLKVRGKSRVDQIVEWVGKDFDGVIAFDESHNMANAVAEVGTRGKKDAAQKALAGLELQKRLPNARVVYVSATGATEVTNLAYADRLGLWGAGTPFPDRADFVSKVSSGGIAAMELVARDMKAMGHYIARNLSYDGVEYNRLEHTLTADQRPIYDKLAEAWQIVLQNFMAALEDTSGTVVSSKRKSAINAQFWGTHQRFFNQIITAMQMPSVLSSVEADLAAGRQSVLQLVNTMEAAQERALEKHRQSGEGEIEDLDMTPRDQLMQMVASAYPVQRYEDATDENGSVFSRPVVDSEGKPVINQEAVAARERLLNQLGSLRVPDGPLEILFNHFGTDKIAEVTGRKQRVVRKPDENGEMKTVVEQRGAQSNIAEAQAFQGGKKKILVFSEAGGTGRSYHAAIGSGSENARRAHYLVQPGWRADKAVQGFGRTHRTSQASAPIFHLVTTDLQGQKRFISSIARRLSQLGALTKGERRAGDQGLFSMRDNLESGEATLALNQFFKDVYAGEVENITMDDLEKGMGLKLIDPRSGGLTTNLPEMSKFLNRVLSLTIDRQNLVFQEFSNRLDAVIERAAAAGTLDTGVETYRADKITKQSEQTVFTDPRSGAETKHVHLEVHTKNEPADFEETLAGRVRTGGERPLAFVMNKRSGRVFAVSRASSYTNKDGAVVDQYRLTSPVDYQFMDRADVDRENWERVNEDTARTLWGNQVANMPEYRKSALHLITGAILPIWDRLSGSPKIYRLQTDAGERMLGRVVPTMSINDTLGRLGVSGVKTKMSAQDAVDRILGGDVAELANRWKIKPSVVAGERRLELVGPDYRSEPELAKHGVFTERIGYQTRFFIPVGETAPEALRAITANRPIVRVGSEEATIEEPSQGPREELAEHPGFPVPLYSATSRAVDNLKQAKGTGEQMLAMISKAPGVKPEEIKYMGLDDWLRGQKSVTKEQIQDYVRANSLNMQEVTKGENHVTLASLEPEIRALGITKPINDVSGADLERAGASDDLVERLYQSMGMAHDATKYRSYALEGGDNYREMLLTLPPKQTKPWEVFDPRNGNAVAGFDTADEARLDAVRRGRDFDYGRSSDSDNPARYKSAHWNEPNVVAHIRFDKRTAPDGARVLMVHEIQSDWHQEGRRQGYRHDQTTHYVHNKRSGNRSEAFPTYEAAEAYRNSLPESIRDSAVIRTRRQTWGNVPDAPFKTSWPALAMRRMIKYAADNGFDRVAWSPGEVHADRYDLSKHIDRVEFSHNEDGTYGVGAIDHNDKEVWDKERATQKDLEDALGKEVADKIINAKSDRLGGLPQGVLTDLDLKVGGEGMAGFYDNILPKETNRIVGKYGAKVGQSEIAHGKPDHENLKPDAQAIEGVRAEFASMEAELTLLEQDGRMETPEAQALEDRMDALYNRMLDETWERAQGTTPVHSFDITPELRDAAQTEGLPLFEQKGEQADRKSLPTKSETFTDLLHEAPESGHEAAADWVLQKGQETGHEHVAIVNNATGEIVHAGTNGNAHMVSIPANALLDADNAYTIHHNHEHGTAQSPEDLEVVVNPGVSDVVVHGHNGEVAIASIGPNGIKGGGARTAEAVGDNTKRMAQTVKGAQGRAENALYDLLAKGEITQAEAEHYAADFRNRLLAGMGVIEYRSSYNLPEPMQRALASELAKNGVTRGDAAFDRSTQHIRPDQRTAGLPQASGDQPGSRLAGDAAGRGAGEAGAGEATQVRAADEGRGELHEGDDQLGDRLYSFPGMLFDPATYRNAFNGVKAFDLRKTMELAPHSRDNMGLARKAADEVQTFFSPTTRGQGSQQVERIIRNRTSQLARATDQSASALEKFSRGMRKLTPLQQVAITDNVERGRPQALPEITTAMNALKTEQDKWLRNIQSIGKLQDLQDSETYMGRIYKNYREWNAGQVAAAGSAGANRAVGSVTGKRPLVGPAGFLKQRTFEFLTDAMAAGLEPVTTNPIDMQILKLHEMQRFYYGSLAVSDLKSSGIAQFFKPTQYAKAKAEGWVELNDPAFHKMLPADRFGVGGNNPPPGMMIDPGAWFAPEPAARVFNNFMSRGLAGRSVLYDSIRRFGNMVNSLQLGLSAFHFTFVTLDSIMSHMALGFEQAARAGTGNDLGAQSRLGSLGKGVAKVATTPISPFTTMYRGAKLRKAWLDPLNATPEMQKIADMLNAGGGRIGMDRFYQSSAAGSFFKRLSDFKDPLNPLREIMQMFKDNKWLAAPRIIGRIIDTISVPIMGFLVPRMKLGVFCDMAKEYLDRHPTATPQEASKAMTDAWDSVDNRMGQLVYDNIFWNKVQKDIAMGLTRSPGWNLGTVREILGGGGVDSARFVNDLVHGRRPDFTGRMGYVIGMAVVTALVNALLQYLMTGKGPDEAKDLLYPHDDEATRYTIPGYPKDMLAAWKDPRRTAANKLNPGLGLLNEFSTNRDYYGASLYDEDRDPSRAAAYGNWLANAGVPFSIKGLMKARENQASPAWQAASFFGIQTAPPSIQNPEKEEMYEQRQKMKAFRQRAKEPNRIAPFSP